MAWTANVFTNCPPNNEMLVPTRPTCCSISPESKLSSPLDVSYSVWVSTVRPAKNTVIASDTLYSPRPDSVRLR